jgi:hypothetical protein
MQALYYLRHAPAFFALLSNPETGSGAYAWAILDHHPLYPSHVAGMAGMRHCTQFLLVEMVPHELFAQADLKPQSF